MKTATILRHAKQAIYETTDARQLADDYGVRLRQTNRTRKIDPRVIEVAASGFYEFQQDAELRRTLAALRDYAGLDFEYIARNGQTIPTLEIWHERNADAWPAPSYAVTYVQITRSP